MTTATFGIVTDTDELGGLSSELVGRVVAYRPLSTYTTPSKFEQGKQDTVLRTHCYGVANGSLEDLGVRLIFWDVVQRQIKEQTLMSDFAVGVLAKVEQANDPTRHVYILEAPEPSLAEALVAAFNGSRETTPGAPF